MAGARSVSSKRGRAGRNKKHKKISNDLVGVAGVHYVAYTLSRRGMIALSTTRNTASYDLLVANSAGTKHANVQIKTAQRHPHFWPMPASANVRHGDHDYYVLIRRLCESDPPECFLVNGEEAQKEVRRIESLERKGGRGQFPCIWVDGTLAKRGSKEAWKKAWDGWIW